MSTLIRFRDISTNEQLVGQSDELVAGGFPVGQQLIVGGTPYQFAFADITSTVGVAPTIAAPQTVPDGRIAYLWYIPASSLLSNGPNPPNTWVYVYNLSSGCHRFVVDKFRIIQQGEVHGFSTGVGPTVRDVHTAVATIIEAPPVCPPNGADFKEWITSDGAVIHAPNLGIAAGWGGGAIAFYWSLDPQPSGCQGALDTLELAVETGHITGSQALLIKNFLFLHCTLEQYNEGSALLAALGY